MEQDSNTRPEAARMSEGTPTGPLSPQGVPTQAWGPPPGAQSQPQPQQPTLGQTGYAQSPYGPGEPTRQWNVPPSPTEMPALQAQYASPPAALGRRSHRMPIMGPLILITLGVLFLLSNFGIMDWSMWGELWRLWPLVLVAVGVDLLLGRRSPVLSVLITMALLAGGIAFIFAGGGFAGGGKPLESLLSVPLSGAKSASVNVDFHEGQLHMDSLGREDTHLATGTLDYYSDQDGPAQSLDTSGGTAKLHLAQGDKHSGFPAFGHKKGINWDVHLNPQVPIALEVSSNASETNLELESLKLTSLDLSANASDTTITFPEAAGTTKATISGNMTNLDLIIPKGVGARIQASSQMGNIDFDKDVFTKSGDTYTSKGYSTATNKLDIALSANLANVNIESK